MRELWLNLCHKTREISENRKILILSYIFIYFSSSLPFSAQKTPLGAEFGSFEHIFTIFQKNFRRLGWNFKNAREYWRTSEILRVGRILSFLFSFRGSSEEWYLEVSDVIRSERNKRQNDVIRETQPTTPKPTLRMAPIEPLRPWKYTEIGSRTLKSTILIEKPKKHRYE